jgi:hypothetical protein
MDEAEVATIFLLAGMLVAGGFVLGAAGWHWLKSYEAPVITPQDQWAKEWEKIEEDISR